MRRQVKPAAAGLQPENEAPRGEVRIQNRRRRGRSHRSGRLDRCRHGHQEAADFRRLLRWSNGRCRSDQSTCGCAGGLQM